MKKINKKNIVKYAGVGLLATCLNVFNGMHLYDTQVDHLNEYCPLNDIFGVNHQIHEINKNYVQDGIKAYYTENGEVQLISGLKKTILDGKKYYSAPVGYTLNGDQAVKNIKLANTDDGIVLTRGTPIYPEDAQPGELIRKSDINIYNPQVVSVITDSKTKKKTL